ncbi:MAG: ABC transporter substrate-binding protein [Acidobacteriota bacterium]|nr:ABC transporter substrate-binding protein [Acidobacteriota bacterium]
MNVKRIALLACACLVIVTALHLWLNFDWSGFLNEGLPPGKRKLNVAYIPVTCHLTCPVTDYISRRGKGGNIFIPKKFQGFPEIKDALIANRMQAAFIVAPMAMALASQGVPIKIVYLGHRYGSAVVVRKDGAIHSVRDLRGKTLAIPSRFSDEHLIVVRALAKNGMTRQDLHIVEMAPPDVSGALAVDAIDAFSMGEPFPSQAEMGGYGRILFKAAEYWPDFMSCVLVVRQDLIDRRPAAVQDLVDGIARSGLWLDTGRPHRAYASEFVGRYYYNQPPALLRWALTRDLERVIYSRLGPRKPDFDLVRDLMLETGLLTRRIEFAEYVDTRFADGAAHKTSWSFESGTAAAY